MTVEELKAKIREVPDFPVKGVSFKDITTLLRDGRAFREALDALARLVEGREIDVVAAPEARGFVVAAPLAYRLGVGFVPVRKPGKLPWQSIRGEYALEYGKGVLEAHVDAVERGQRVLVADDVLATGGTVATTVDLVEKLNGKVVGVAFLVELTYLGGRKKLAGHDVLSLITY